MARRVVFVFDASPLIALAPTGLLGQLDRMGVEAVVPEEVRDEVVGERPHPGHPERLAIEQLFQRRLISVDRVRDRTVLRRVSANPRLSRADAASLCLARDLRARLIADDRDLRASARALGVSLGGSLFVLVYAADKRIVTPREAVAAVEQMIAHGWYCSPALLKSFSDRIVVGE